MIIAMTTCDILLEKKICVGKPNLRFFLPTLLHFLPNFIQFNSVFKRESNGVFFYIILHFFSRHDVFLLELKAKF